MVNNKDHEIPSEMPENSEGEAKPYDLDVYKKAGGSLSVEEVQKVLNAPYPTEIPGGYGERWKMVNEFEPQNYYSYEKEMALKIIQAFGMDFAKEKGVKWLMNEARACVYYVSPSNRVSTQDEWEAAQAKRSQAVTEVTKAVHAKLTT